MFSRFIKHLHSDALAMGCAVLLLLGAAGNRLALPRASDAASYHARVRAVAETIPMQFADWSSEDVPVPTDAVDQLRPNVIISRRMHNRSTHDTASLLFVQCRDVRDLAPHYPPVCYPGSGLSLTGQTMVSLRVGARTATATRYAFESDNAERGNLLVDNFMVLPDGTFRPDMRGMERRIGADQRYLGAAQIQIIHRDNLPASEQTAVSELILRNYAPLVEAILGGNTK